MSKQRAVIIGAGVGGVATVRASINRTVVDRS